ncbi:pilus assembly protein [Maribius pontilimi]|uniref:Pilus assembly protein n=1 Tax=Palleronia pontilimi TaxID=1964209 RepID=A0A934IJE7_9RHOB|nr:TadE family protein [Palleronia pontilimi]MBJ3763655.1 pilus assembly protein [Palleronia pontilimi]
MLGKLGYSRDERGAVLVEALIAFPVMSIISFGLLEFGYMMWERQQLAMGVRDAARYWSRCRPVFSPTVPSACNETTARNIAFYGTPVPGTNEPRRVPGWDDSSQLLLYPSKGSLSTAPQDDDIVKVVGTVVHQGSPAFSAILSSPVTISYSLEMRQIGW